MIWGTGSALGFLSILGYLVFVAGAVLLWFHRGDVPTWWHDEFGAIRRKMIFHAVPCKCAGLRDETRFKFVPTRFLRRLGRMPRRQINRGAILLCIGPLLFLLDLFI
jgi:hypothetical protein